MSTRTVARRLAGAIAAVAAIIPAAPALAIRNGAPDTEHPSVGLVRFTRAADGPQNDRGWCTGTLIADRVVLTAAHCIGGPAERFTSFFVTFNAKLINNPLVDPSVAGEYLSGTPYADPRYQDNGPSENDDRAVIVLDGSAKAKWGIDPVPLPPLGFMDRANHGNTLGDTFTIAGYGIGLDDGRAKPTVVVNRERRVTTVSLANTQAASFALHNNSDGQSAVAGGGSYPGDSGSSAFWEPYPYALGTLSSGATGIGFYARTDTAAARAFLGRFVTLP